MEFLRECGVNIDNSLELLGDIETYNEILGDYYEEIEDRIKNLEEYKNNKDMKNYNILVHTMKSDLKYLGFDELSDICLEHQIKSEENNSKYVEDNFVRLVDELKKANEIIGKYMERI